MELLRSITGTKLSFFLLFLLIAMLWLVMPALVYWLVGDTGKSGQIGDTFNIANSLFSGVALLGVLYTVISNQQEFKERERNLQHSQEISARQINHSILSIRLQYNRLLMEEYRKSLKELRPDIIYAPTSKSKLIDIKENLKGKFSPSRNDNLPEVIEVIDILLELHDELLGIRASLREKFDA